MSLYLSRADVARKACRKQKRRQIEQLTRMGIQFELDGEGWPLVKDPSAPQPRLEPKPPLDDSWEWREWPLRELEGPTALLHQPCVYFLRAVCDDGRLGNIKIGYSKQLRNRLLEIVREFRFKSGWRLEVLNSVQGDKILESHIHSRFAHAREPRGSEWFFPFDELLEFITTAHKIRYVRFQEIQW